MSFRTIALAVFAVGMIYVFGILMSGFGLNPLGRQWTFDNSAKFGDSFGPLNTLMAALAAVGALGAYFSQKKELEDAKHDANRQRKLALKRDFETTFFNLLALARDTAAEVEASDQYKQNRKKGRDAIALIVSDQLAKSKGSRISDKALYEKVYRENRDDLGHYFRILYQILRFVDESEIEDKSLYVRIFRASLSNAEMILLGLNCAYGGGYPKFKALVERYALLHNISSSQALAWRLDKEFEQSAFGDRDLAKDSTN